MTTTHSEITLAEGRHSVIAYEYADAAARTSASGFSASQDIGKVARQLSDGTYWVLLATTPVWGQWEIGGAGTLNPPANPGDDGKLAFAVAGDLAYTAGISVLNAGAAQDGLSLAVLEVGTGTKASAGDIRVPATFALLAAGGAPTASILALSGGVITIGQQPYIGQVIIETAGGGLVIQTGAPASLSFPSSNILSFNTPVSDCQIAVGARADAGKGRSLVMGAGYASSAGDGGDWIAMTGAGVAGAPGIFDFRFGGSSVEAFTIDWSGQVLFDTPDRAAGSYGWRFETGAASAGASGNFQIGLGQGTSGGSINIAAGEGTATWGGNCYCNAGDGVTAGGGTGFAAGNSTGASSTPGNASLTAGSVISGGTGTGGSAVVGAGTGTVADGSVIARVGPTDVAEFTRLSSNPAIGFFGVTPVVRPDVTGSRGGNAALADLLTDLASLGLITDSTSA